MKMNTSTITPDTIYLSRLSRFIDVVYAVIFFHIVSQYLPHFEDMTWTEKPYGDHCRSRTGALVLESE
jgi:hypothetical protein